MPGTKLRSGAGATLTSPARHKRGRSFSIYFRVLLVVAALSLELTHSGSSFAAAGSDAGGDAVLLSMPQFSATLYDGDKPVGILSTVVILEISGDKRRAAVFQDMPKLVDAFVRALNQLAVAEGQLGQEYGPLEIKRAFQLVADHVLGQGVIDGILVEGISRSSGG